MPHNADEIVNSRIAPTNNLTCPMRWVSQPVSGIATASAAENTVITHVHGRGKCNGEGAECKPKTGQGPAQREWGSSWESGSAI